MPRSDRLGRLLLHELYLPVAGHPFSVRAGALEKLKPSGGLNVAIMASSEIDVSIQDLTPSTDRHTLSRVHPDITPREAARERKERGRHEVEEREP